MVERFRKSNSRTMPSVEQQKSVAEPSAGVFTTNCSPEMGSLLTRPSDATLPDRASKRRTQPSIPPQKMPAPVGIYSIQLIRVDVLELMLPN